MIEGVSDLILWRKNESSRASFGKWLTPDMIDVFDGWVQGFKYNFTCYGHEYVAAMRIAKGIRDGYIVLGTPIIDYWKGSGNSQQATWEIADGLRLWVYVNGSPYIGLSARKSKESFGVLDPSYRVVFQLEDFNTGPRRWLFEQVFARIRSDPELAKLEWGAT
jgi:hypothetical protein